MGKNSKHPFHGEACRIRKMTDSQMSDFVRELMEKAALVDDLKRRAELHEKGERANADLTIKAYADIERLQLENKGLKELIEKKEGTKNSIECNQSKNYPSTIIYEWITRKARKIKGIGPKTINLLLEGLNEDDDEGSDTAD